MTARLKIGIMSVIYGGGAEAYLKNFKNQAIKLSKHLLPLVVDHGGHAFNRNDFEQLGIRYICQNNKGFSSGVNLGSSCLFEQCSYVYVFNPDLLFDFEEMNRLVDNNLPDFCVLSVLENGIDRSVYYYSVLTGAVSSYKKPFTFPFFNGAAFGWSKQVFSLTKGFDDRYFLYFEDVDFSKKLAACEIHINVIATKSFTHAVGGSRSGESKAIIEKVSAVSAILFAVKWLWWNPFILLRYVLKWMLASVRYRNV
jgi:N-acetylglucosaminyl-diphospho-decaprenol L-rhamnosyltransferase